MSPQRGSRWIALEPFVLFAILTALSWQLFYIAREVPWLWRHYEDVNTGLFLYLPLIPMLWGRRPEPETAGEVGTPPPRESLLEHYGLTLRDGVRGLGIFLLAAAVIFPVHLLAWYTASIRGPAWFRPDFDPHIPQHLFSLAQFHLLYVALPEEFFFRAYVQTRLDQVWTARTSLMGAKVGWSLPVAAGLFALAHPLLSTPFSSLLSGQGWINLDTFFPGLLFGWLRIRTGSLLAPVLMHWSCNLLLFSFVGR